MPVALYDLTIPVLGRGLGNLSVVLDKGRTFAEVEGLDPAELLAARLAPDMLSLIGQVQRASDTAKFAAVRIGQVENARFPDEETSFDELQERIALTRGFLDAVPRAAFDTAEEATIAATIGRLPVTVSARDYVLQFALPNFFFHATAAYALLRQRGVPLGKMDYIGPLG